MNARRSHRKRRRRALGTAKWQRLRAAVIKRDRGRCTRCRSTTFLEVHHIDAIGSGGEEFPDPSRLTTLCKACHLGMSRRPPPSDPEWSRFVGELLDPGC